MSFRIIIPARYGSKRLPGKPLAAIAGKPLIQHVHERAVESGATSVTIATDDERIANAAREFGADSDLTSASHQSGTDRVAEIVAAREWQADDIIVNLQGDEPLMPPECIDRAARTLEEDRAAGIATLATPITARHEFDSPDAVKVVLDERGRAMYFSRAPIPAARESDPDERVVFGLRHIGLYAYRARTLRRLAQTPPCELELTERLEQLRALWLGVHIAVATVEDAPPAGVDSPADLKRVEKAFTALVS